MLCLSVFVCETFCVPRQNHASTRPMPMKKKLDKNAQNHARTLIVKNLIRMHVNTRPMAKNRSDLKKLAGKKMFAPLQGSPVPNDTLVLTWIEKVKITWYWGNLIGLMRRCHMYIRI
jgi:hypothetical protein